MTFRQWFAAWLVACKSQTHTIEHDDRQPTPPAPVVELSASSEPLPPPIADARTYTPIDASTDTVAMGDWMKVRLANAAAGRPELVRMPLHQHGPGWGCICPFFYVGTEESDPDDTTFIDPQFETTSRPPSLASTRMVEGYFTGRTTQAEGDNKTKYTLYGFRSLRDRALTQAEDNEPPRALVLAAGSEAGFESPPPADKRAFLLIDASFPLSGAGAFDAAAKRADRFKARYPNVQVIDSRTVPGLFCCNYVVVLDRFVTEGDAEAELANAKKTGAVASVRRGW